MLTAAMLWSLCVALPAHAITVDFNELTSTEQQLFGQVVSGGFVFTNNEGASDALGVWARDQPYQADPDEAAIFVNRAYTSTTATQVDGLPFDFQAIDLTDLYNMGDTITVEFTFQYASGGASVETVTLAGAQGLRTCTFNKVGLVSVSWRTVAGANGWSQFDNFVASIRSTVSLAATE
jgi:hypothetical protein